jgi:hypothetical protein
MLSAKQLKEFKIIRTNGKGGRPKNIVEHMKIVSGDIQKVFIIECG